MRHIEVHTPDDKPDDDKLIQYRLIEKSYEVKISLMESLSQLRFIGLYTRDIIDDSEMWEVTPDREYEEYER